MVSYILFSHNDARIYTDSYGAFPLDEMLKLYNVKKTHWVSLQQRSKSLLL